MMRLSSTTRCCGHGSSGVHRSPCNRALAAGAQQGGKVRGIGVLTLRNAVGQGQLTALRRDSGELGWLEGQNYVLTLKAADYRSERLPDLVAELVRLKMDVLVADSAEGALAAKRGTRTAPIVAATVADAVAIGLVDSLARPGGNVTGLSFLGTELIGKQMQLLKEAIPRLSRMGILSNPANPTHEPQLREVDAVAQALALLRIERVNARTPTEVDQAFATMAQTRMEGVLVLSDPLLSGEQKERVAQLALKGGLPSTCMDSGPR